jgi:hypothetical protein
VGAKRRWIPLSTEFPHDKTGTRLQEEFGPAGIAVWVALLTAAKRAHVQGQFSYVSEAEAWEKLGVHGASFSLDEFFRVTGQMKKTRKRRRGHITDVQITGWGEWNDTPRTGSGRQQNPSVSHDSARLDRASEKDSDSEIEREIEIDESNPFFKFLRKKGLLDE